MPLEGNLGPSYSYPFEDQPGSVRTMSRASSPKRAIPLSDRPLHRVEDRWAVVRVGTHTSVAELAGVTRPRYEHFRAALAEPAFGEREPLEIRERGAPAGVTTMRFMIPRLRGPWTPGCAGRSVEFSRLTSSPRRPRGRRTSFVLVGVGRSTGSVGAEAEDRHRRRPRFPLRRTRGVDGRRRREPAQVRVTVACRSASDPGPVHFDFFSSAAVSGRCL